MLFPVTIVDNFFEDPDYIVKYAKSLKYEDLDILPGSRTDALHNIDQEFFNWITSKSLKLKKLNGADLFALVVMMLKLMMVG